MPNKPLPLVEFILMLATMISIVAMATDVMLPALADIGRDLRLAEVNDAQLVVSSFFLGFALGQVFVGPLSDSFGRKPVVYMGYAVFIVGCVLSVITTSWTFMLIGRVLQGLGAAAPRVVTVALVRDGYEGRAMARIMSVVMAVFIIVPAIAPGVGQGLMLIGGWRATFAGLIGLGFVGFLWFLTRQPETLPHADRRVFSLANIAGGLREILANRMAVGYTLATGSIFGAFLGYLSSAQQIFQTTFAVGQMFALYFGVAALSIGSASIFNSRVVMRIGMRRLTSSALSVVAVTSFGFLFLIKIAGIDPPLAMFMTWLLVVFFCMGILFGNLNALAMEPLGHMAGLGAAFVGSVSTFISLPLGWAVGNQFDGTVVSLVLGFATLSLISLAIIYWTERGRIFSPHS